MFVVYLNPAAHAGAVPPRPHESFAPKQLG